MSTAGSHAPDELLEQYALQQLQGEDLDALEEHLLVCESCRSRLEETSAFLRAIREAARRLEMEDRAHQPGLWGRLSTLWGAVPQPVWGAAALAAVALAFVPLYRTRQPAGPIEFTPVMIQDTLRGQDGGVAAVAGKPVQLHLNARSLPARSRYRLELVTESGRKVWSAIARPRQDSLIAEIAGGAGAGPHWLRVYDENDELLREYAVRFQ